MTHQNPHQKGLTDYLEPDFQYQDQFLDELRKAANEGEKKFSGSTSEPNPFPIDAFPLGVQEIIKATHQSLRFPPDFIGSAMLTAAATAIGITHTAYVMESWQESAVLYMALVAPPGSNKSHPLSFAFKPLSKRDDEAYHTFDLEKKDYDLIREQRDNKRGQVEINEKLIEPVLKKTLFADTTLEALTKLHSNNLRGVCVVADELAGFIKNLSRYNNGGDTEFWLSSWSGKSVSYDRLIRSSVRLKRPFIPFIGTIQNSVLFQLAKDGKGDNGFIDRILFSILQDLKKQPWSEVKLNPIYEHNWEKYIRNLLELKLELDGWGNPIPRQLKFSDKAWLILKEWQVYNSNKCNEAETEALQGVYSKLETYTIRISLILQLLAWSCGEADRSEIQSKAVEGAIKLVEYFRKTASTVQRIIHKADPLDRCDRKQRATYEMLPERFTTAGGLKIAAEIGFAKRTFNDFLKNRQLFEKVDHGLYEKLI